MCDTPIAHIYQLSSCPIITAAVLPRCCTALSEQSLGTLPPRPREAGKGSRSGARSKCLSMCTRRWHDARRGKDHQSQSLHSGATGVASTPFIFRSSLSMYIYIFCVIFFHVLLILFFMISSSSRLMFSPPSLPPSLTLDLTQTHGYQTEALLSPVLPPHGTRLRLHRDKTTPQPFFFPSSTRIESVIRNG